MEAPEILDRVTFTINGRKYSAGSEFTADLTLNEYIRRYAELRGTKYMCREGGCGACVVHVRAHAPASRELSSFSVNSGGCGACVVHVRAHAPASRELSSFSVNSCLVAIMSCDGWDITTIEGIGNRKIGYNIIQKRLNHFFGSQCGYCSPGFVMSMYSLVHGSDHHLTEAEIENSLGSNLCRCTGYRPILEAFKSLAIHPDANILSKIKDIEDISEQICPKSGKTCGGTCGINEDWCLVNMNNMSAPDLPKKISLADGRVWFSVSDVRSIFAALDDVGYDSYMLVAGNTAKGVRPILEYPKLLIDISDVKELATHYLDINLVLGANMTLTDTMHLFKELCESNDDFWYLGVLYNHMEQVAHIPVRNIGTLAGNLALKNSDPSFQSDIFLLLDCVGATVTLVDRESRQTEMNLPEFLTIDMKGKVMTQIKLRPLSRHYELVTYKIKPREQNAQAYINSGFLLKFNPSTHLVEEASIVYGNINPSFTHAYDTEKFLIGRNIFNNETLQSALYVLKKEINPDVRPPYPPPFARKKVALGLFYKCIIKLCPKDILKTIYKSGATTPTDDRPPVSRSYQEYDTDKKDFPITQPMLKKEGMIQCAGEAVYTDDTPAIKDEVFAALVLSTVAKADIESIDSSEVLKVDGVLAVLTSKDIPGVNSNVRADFLLFFENEELLASNKILYYNQPVAVVVAVTQVLADKMACLVKVNYKNISKKPIVFTIEDAIHAPKEENRLIPYPGIVPLDRGANIRKVVKGTFIGPRQYHNMMELHTTITKPVDEGLEVISSAQFMDLTQAAIAQLLKMPESLIIVKTRRCGGGFGAKISRNNFAACVTALVAKKLNKPCRMSMPMHSITRATGKRPNSRLDYEVGVDDRGEIQYMDAVFYVNDGISRNENENLYVTTGLQNCYDSRRWKCDNFGVITDAPSNVFMRAPGNFHGISGIEHIMDHIAQELNRDPAQVRMANYRREDNDLPTLLPMFLDRINYRDREKQIKEFNNLNRWKKRAIRLSNMAYPSAYLGNYGALVSVYHGDGSVVINIGGIEIGQGIFTKMSQVAASEFNIPVETVTVIPCLNIATPNNFATASSITSECCAYAVIRSCDQINARLAPFRAAMPTASWREIVFEADRQGVLLQANYLTSPNDPRLVNYSIFGISVTEVEVDILTGSKWIVRADIFEDVGRSMNPAIDVGQVEGAFAQGTSLWMMENTVYNKYTGELYSDRTWTYKILGAKDIPFDFRVYFRRKRPNPVGILGSKAVGEPPCALAHVVVESLRDAILASRKDSGYDSNYVCLKVPVNLESIVEAADVKIEEFLLY
ncbi:hypothetical protein PYW08_006916 [Mythimna loreyi]|uniref:Uncharacterized protein n=1 Tax=Mythimna loreyi TaxID=667449 RepID=A0ACC2R892_9NEOP|nr:hypothetical protein PYW08_006916 [Mythimna loreyi]